MGNAYGTHYYVGTCYITCVQQSVCEIKIKDISVAQISILDY